MVGKGQGASYQGWDGGEGLTWEGERDGGSHLTIPGSPGKTRLADKVQVGVSGVFPSFFRELKLCINIGNTSSIPHVSVAVE